MKYFEGCNLPLQLRRFSTEDRALTWSWVRKRVYTLAFAPSSRVKKHVAKC